MASNDNCRLVLSRSKFMKTAIIGCVVISFVIATNLAMCGESTPPATVEAAESIANKVAGEMDQAGKLAPEAYRQMAEPLLNLLESEDVAIRAVGLRALHKTVYGVSLNRCVPYFNKGPIEERIEFLTICLAHFPMGLPAYEIPAVEPFKTTIREILLDSHVPPRFPELVASLATLERYRREGMRFGAPSILEIIPEAERPLLAKRVLLILSKANVLFPFLAEAKEENATAFRKNLFQMLLSLGEKDTGAAIEEWSKIEPEPNVRSIILNEELSWSRSQEWAARRKSILEFATKDHDIKIAAKSRGLLEKD